MNSPSTNPASTGAPPRDPAWLKPAYAAYGLYAWILFAFCALLAVLVVLLLPGLDLRRRAASAVARGYLLLIGVPLRRLHAERLPPGQSVVVANHASYIDGLVMKAALPPRFSYVVKREMDGVPLAGLLLRRIGTEFVERFDRHKGASDARRVLRTAASGQSLVFFPEGTFAAGPGLLRFHTGAFATAVRTGCPVVPAVIRGSRRILPSHRFLPRWGSLEIEFLEPLTPHDPDAEHAAVELRDRARAAILARLDEPDAA
jgi:1-acyl-sn-glycerol-3-phosphate acyltransferase